MSKHQLKSTIRRGAIFGAVFALVAATFAPAASTYADALNPLTERSLTLSSSSPGWSFTDASGNGTYAPPNSGANGNKTGNTFSFRVSTTKALRGMTFQYCTTPAGNCMGPGNNSFTGTPEDEDVVRAANGPTEYSNQRSDLEVVIDEDTLGEVSTFDTKFDKALGQPAREDDDYDPDDVHPNVPNRDGSEGNYIVMTKAPADTEWTQIEGWEMDATVNQTFNGVAALEEQGKSTNKANYITLTLPDAETAPTIDSGDYVKIIFFGTDENYIINPGDQEFFVKINTYEDDELATLVDGGVTVANVMNRSIEIQTKVLETMDFSVGTVDPNTLDSTDPDPDPEIKSQLEIATGKTQHGPCDAIVQSMDAEDDERNVLRLGDEDGEFSLRTDTTYSTHSYWRLSSNSSGGATVYYSGVTLSNTVGDQIAAIGTTESASVEGSEQFGLALANATTGDREVSYVVERDELKGVFESAEDNATNGIHTTTTTEVGANPSYHAPRLAPLAPEPAYAAGVGAVNSEYGTIANTKFAFDPESTVIPAPFATGNQVLDCVTGKMRYIANIAATTPAGIYTTKINYIAAPQY